MFEKIGDPKQKALLGKINGIGLAAFLVLIGVLWILPKGTLPETAWVIGLGLILIGGNIARHLNGIRLCHCTVIFGVVLLLAGVCGLFGVEVPIFPVLIILAGIGIVYAILSKKKCSPERGSNSDSYNQGEETNTEN
jgi:hypothetical protein